MKKNTYEQDVLLAIKYHYGSSRSNSLVLHMIEYHTWFAPSPLDAYTVVYGMFAETLNKNSNGRFLTKFHDTLRDNARHSQWFDGDNPPTPAQFIFDALVSAVRLTPYKDFGFEDDSGLPECDPEFHEFLKEKGYA